MNARERWLRAQKYEKKYWIAHKYETDNDDNIIYYMAECKKVFDDINNVYQCNKNSKVLQIGAGHRDVISFWPLGKKYAIDPLRDFYKRFFSINNDINYVRGIAEKLPYKAKYFDIIIINNVLDHIINPEKALAEVSRVIKNKGILYIKVNVFGLFSYHVHRLAKFFGLDRGHPHTFSITSIDKILSKNFVINSRKFPDRKKFLKTMTKNTNIKIRLLGYLNIAVLPYTVICKK